MRKPITRLPIQHDGEDVGSIFLRYRTWWFRLKRDGRAVDINLRTHDRHEAEALAEIEAAKTPALPLPNVSNKVRSLREAFEVYEDFYRKRRRPSSARRTLEVLESFLGFVGDDTKPVGIVDRPLIIRWRDEREQSGLSPWTINNDVGRVARFLRWCEEEGHLTRVPNLKKLKLTTEDKAARGLSQREVELVQEKLTEEFYREWFIVAINVGFRPDEQAHLRACDYDPETRKAHIRPWGGWKPKTKKGKRSPVVTEEVHEILTRRKLAAGSPEAPLFPTSVGTLWHLDTLRHRFQARLPEGFYFTLYALRHTFAYRCVASGWSSTKLCLYMGHSDPKTTMGYYEGIELGEIGAPPVSSQKRIALA
jgi:integrase